MVRRATVVVLAGLLAAYSHAPSAQQAIGLSPGESASGLASQPDRRYRFVCAAVAVPAKNVWGTGEYADDSAICSAAIHAGLLQLGQAGLVTIVIGQGASSFRGSEQNGVISSEYSNDDASYRFDTSADPGQISWTTTALRIPRGFTDPVAVICPAGGPTKGIVWGTNPYISDSSICLAGVHAGLITPADGGPLTVTHSDEPRNFPGEPKNSIESRGWSGSDDSFTISAGSADGTTPAQSGGRRIKTDGFKGAGETIPPQRRIITTEGWTGQGAVP